MNTDSEDYYLEGMTGSTFSMSVKTMYSSEIRKKYNNKSKPCTEEPESDHKQHTDSGRKAKKA